MQKKRTSSQQAGKPAAIPRAPDAGYLERAALYYLERFAASSAQLEAVLRRKIMRRCKARGESPEPFYEHIAPLIVRYQQSGLLDDTRYAAAKVATLKRKGNSSRMISAKLAAKGVAKEVVNAQIALDETSELDAARNMVRRKKLGIKEEQRMKDLAVLGRAGFSYAIAKQVLDEAISDQQ